MNAAKFVDAADIHDISRGEELLLHGGNQVSAAGQYLDVAAIARKMADRILEGAWEEKFESRQAHWDLLIA